MRRVVSVADDQVGVGEGDTGDEAVGGEADATP